jgi:predicted transcriptional regulator
VQIAALPDGAGYFSFARTVTQPVTRWGEPRLILQFGACQEVAYADRLDLERAKVGIGFDPTPGTDPASRLVSYELATTRAKNLVAGVAEECNHGRAEKR